MGFLSKNNLEHTKTMNLVEGFFGIGAIVGPALVSFLITQQVSWTYLYVIAGVLCLILTLIYYFYVILSSTFMDFCLRTANK